MRHYVQTAHGNSTTFYEGTKKRPLQGGGQGNGAAGPMWIAISCILLSIMTNTGISATLISAITLSAVAMNAIMYVDDTDIIITADKDETQQNLHNKAQNLIDKWRYSLWLTGGCLRPDKCWWYSIAFKWDTTGKWRYKKSSETNGDIYVPDHKQQKQQIAKHEVNVGKEGLGIHLAPDGNDKDQFNAMMDKANKWA